MDMNVIITHTNTAEPLPENTTTMAFGSFEELILIASGFQIRPLLTQLPGQEKPVLMMEAEGPEGWGLDALDILSRYFGKKAVAVAAEQDGRITITFDTDKDTDLPMATKEQILEGMQLYHRVEILPFTRDSQLYAAAAFGRWGNRNRPFLIIRHLGNSGASNRLLFQEYLLKSGEEGVAEDIRVNLQEARHDWAVTEDRRKAYLDMLAELGIIG